jgi:hypothetical protein
LGLHKGLYIFNQEFWKNLYDLRKQLNYQTAISDEIFPTHQLSEEEEVELIKQLLKEARDRKKLTSERNLDAEQFQKGLKENIRKKRRARLGKFANH